MLRSLLAGAAIAFQAGSAFAQTEGTYLTLEGRLLGSVDVASSQNRITQSAGSPRFSGTAYGYDFGNGFKTEIEGLRANESAAREGGLIASGSLSTSSVMLNGLYELRDGGWRLKPYVGAGFGMIDVRQRLLGVLGNNWVSAAQVRGGISLGFTQKLLGSLEYRWTMGSKPRFLLAGIPTKLEVDRHGFVLGVNYKY